MFNSLLDCSGCVRNFNANLGAYPQNMYVSRWQKPRSSERVVGFWPEASAFGSLSNIFSFSG
jgi:hypothetical protein